MTQAEASELLDALYWLMLWPEAEPKLDDKSALVAMTKVFVLGSNPALAAAVADRARRDRDEGRMHPDAAFHVLHSVALCRSLQREPADTVLEEIRERMDAIENEHGLDEDDDSWCESGVGPPEYDALYDKLLARQNELMCQDLRAFGEHEMAALLEQKAEHDAVEDRSGRGRTLLAEAAASVPPAVRAGAGTTLVRLGWSRRTAPAS